MAFVFLSEKSNQKNQLFPKSSSHQFLNNQISQIQECLPAPGHYDSLKQSSVNKESLNIGQVPFNTKQTRLDPSETLNQAGFANHSPGPGQYKLPSSFKQTQVFHDIYEPGTYYIMEDNQIKKRVQGYLPKNIVHTTTVDTNLVNGPKYRLYPTKQSYFSQLIKQNEIVPGPGQYNTNQEQKNGHFLDEQQGILLHKSRSKSQMKLRDLVLKEYLQIKQEINQVVSPASYTPRIEPSTQKGGIWGKSKVERKTIFDVPEAEKDALQPELQALDLRKLRQEAKSQMKKSQSASTLLKTNQKYQKQRPAITSQFIDEDNQDEYLESDDDALPGPGSYFNNQNQSTFKKFTKRKSHQFFGSSTQRFLRAIPLSQSTQGQAIGPGYYNHEVSQDRQNYFQNYTSSFASQKSGIDIFSQIGKPALDTQNFTYIPSPRLIETQENKVNSLVNSHLGQAQISSKSQTILVQTKPAPGNYNPYRSEFDQIVQQTEKVTGILIPKEQRFKVYDQQFVEQRSNPAPGTYIRDKLISKKNFQDSTFKSKTPRILTNTDIQQQSDLGNHKTSKQCYMMGGNKELEKEEHDQVIETKKQKFKAIYKDYFKQGLGKVDGSIVQYQSIQSKTEDDQNQANQYLMRAEKQNQNIRMNNNFQKLPLGKQNHPNLPKEERFKNETKLLGFNNCTKEKDQKTNKQPGPGEYSKIMPEWNKRTYNLRFIGQE